MPVTISSATSSPAIRPSVAPLWVNATCRPAIPATRPSTGSSSTGIGRGPACTASATSAGWPASTADASVSSSGTRASGALPASVSSASSHPAPTTRQPSGVGRSDTRGALTTTRTLTSTGRVRTRAAGECSARIGTPSSPSMGRHRGAGGHDDRIRVDLRPVREPDALHPVAVDDGPGRAHAGEQPPTGRREPADHVPDEGREIHPALARVEVRALGRHRDAGHRAHPAYLVSHRPVVRGDHLGPLAPEQPAVEP